MLKRRVPTWLKVTLGVFGVLFVLGAIFGGRSPAPSGVTTAAGPTTTTPPVATYTVTSVDGTTVELTDASGERTSVRAAGMVMPIGANCYGAETASWASAFLTGKQVTVKTLDTLAVITLSDGTSYSTAAVQGGHAKYLADALSATYGPALQAAETSARAAGTGLWGPPCHGNIDAPVVTTTQALPPVQKVTAPDPTTHEEAPPASTEDVDVSYANCTEVRAAHAAPIHRGEPGYSRKLDRDGDGVACEK